MSSPILTRARGATTYLGCTTVFRAEEFEGGPRKALVCRQHRECELWVRCVEGAVECECDCLPIYDRDNVWMVRNEVSEKSALVTVSHINGMDRRPHCM